MSDQLRAILIGFGVVFFGWYVLLVIRPGAGLEVLPVLLGLAAGLAARRPIGLLGAPAGFLTWYLVAFVGGDTFDGEWQGPALMFTLLIASGYAGGLALLWLRNERGARAAETRA